MFNKKWLIVCQWVLDLDDKRYFIPFMLAWSWIYFQLLQLSQILGYAAGGWSVTPNLYTSLFSGSMPPKLQAFISALTLSDQVLFSLVLWWCDKIIDIANIGETALKSCPKVVNTWEILHVSSLFMKNFFVQKGSVKEVLKLMLLWQHILIRWKKYM